MRLFITYHFATENSVENIFPNNDYLTLTVKYVTGLCVILNKESPNGKENGYPRAY